jgi:butyryl-CoA dehydrogenase
MRDFADREVAPGAVERDRDGSFPYDLVRKMGDIGLFGLPLPAEYGGSDADLTTLCLAIEELARVDASVAITLSAAVGLGATPIARFGTAAQKARWLPDLCTGDAIAAFGLTEPGAGSDASALQTRARREMDGWVIDGAKAFITNSGTDLTSVVTIAACTDDSEISAFLVPSNASGLTVEPPYIKMGWRASDTHGLALSECRVDDDALLGTRGEGFRQMLAVLDEGRIAIAALAVGTLQACLDLSVEHACTRTAFGVPIGKNQGVSFPIADMAVALDGARALTYRAAWLRDRGRPFKRAAAVAKLWATEAAVTSARTTAQIFGGSAFIEDTVPNRIYRDVKVLEIGEGTSEVQRMVIARSLGL